MSPISQDEIKQIADEVHKSSPPRKTTPAETKISERSWLSLPVVLIISSGLLVFAGVSYGAKEALANSETALKKVEDAAREHEHFRTKDAINDEQHRQIMEALSEIKKFIEDKKK